MRRFLMPVLLPVPAPASAAEWKPDDPANRTVMDIGPETLRAVLAKIAQRVTLS